MKDLTPSDISSTQTLKSGDLLVKTAFEDPGETALTLDRLLVLIGTINQANVAERFSSPLLLQLYETIDGGRLPFETASFKSSDLSSREIRNLLDSRVLPVQKRDDKGIQSMVTLGRAPNCDLVLPVPHISKFHLWFKDSPRGWVVADAGSTNGTQVDGCRVEKGRPANLDDGTVLTLADRFHFRFVPPEGLCNLLKSAEQLKQG